MMPHGSYSLLLFLCFPDLPVIEDRHQCGDDDGRGIRCGVREGKAHKAEQMLYEIENDSISA